MKIEVSREEMLDEIAKMIEVEFHIGRAVLMDKVFFRLMRQYIAVLDSNRVEDMPRMIEEIRTEFWKLVTGEGMDVNAMSMVKKFDDYLTKKEKEETMKADVVYKTIAKVR